MTSRRPPRRSLRHTRLRDRPLATPEERREALARIVRFSPIPVIDIRSRRLALK
jgi:hypothetical protein